MKLIQVRKVTKYFDIYNSNFDRIKKIFSNKRSENRIYALKDVSLDIFSGEILGIVGLNGSGKSTLCNILSGKLLPNAGVINTFGTVSLLSIGVGLNTGLTGAENIIQKCLLQGFSKVKIKKFFDEIVSFSELGEQIYQPVKEYSSGMKARLGFSISIQIESDILIIDEALAVGDSAFYEKCIEEINFRKKRGKSVIFISHSLAQINQVCDRVIWLNLGQVLFDGDTKKGIKKYKKYVEEYKKLTLEEKQYLKASQVLNVRKDNEKNVKVKNRKATFINRLFLVIIQIILVYFFIKSMR
ncbi:ABC transporter ATP-binding protein [Enterococcus faecalis]|uniref:ABC transporter ATP-binding protein n=1 Tax=Enterococcus faecalis TaxID=1351 RepID=UPI00138741E3|nr:ABC transporter ATP-binding protein [Enterococcus faecalis]MEB7428034.1 ABC transporter ATP-binding protein [Enterococcus faecalis]